MSPPSSVTAATIQRLPERVVDDRALRERWCPARSKSWPSCQVFDDIAVVLGEDPNRRATDLHDLLGASGHRDAVVADAVGAVEDLQRLKARGDRSGRLRRVRCWPPTRTPARGRLRPSQSSTDRGRRNRVEVGAIGAGSCGPTTRGDHQTCSKSTSDPQGGPTHTTNCHDNPPGGLL